MGTIAGSKKLKRQMAPKFWGITRKNKRFVNNTLNKFENRTTNSDVVTFDPTTQLFTDETRNIAFKSYDQAKRWNDAINNEDKKEDVRKTESTTNKHKRYI